jgi:hypothetical protein
VRSAAKPTDVDDSLRGRLFHRARATAAWEVVAPLAVVAFVYAWVLSAGTLSVWPTVTDYFSQQADAFRARQTALLTPPDPQLLALRDPYDPAANRPYRAHDLSLHKERYYLYWGPAPAVLLAAFKTVTADALGMSGDQWLALAFGLGTVFCAAMLLHDLRTRFFPDAPRWTVALAICAVGLANPIPFMMARAAVYEAGILAGQCFLLAGLCILFGAQKRLRQPPAWRFALVGVCWSLALASRLSLAPAVAGLVLLTAWSLRGRPWEGGRLRQLAALAAPLVATVVALGAYNHARFGAWAETGQRYQLGATDLRPLAGHIFSVRHLPPNLHSYLVRPVFVDDAFPFVRPLSATAPGSFPAWLPVPGEYDRTFAVTGLLLASPFLWFAFVAVFWLATRGHADPRAPRPALAWCVLCLLVTALLAAGPVLLLLGSTMRYLEDVTPCLTILAAIGFWLMRDRLPARPRRRGLALWAAFCVLFSIAVGLLLAFSAEGQHFFRHNPDLMAALGATPEPRAVGAAMPPVR